MQAVQCSSLKNSGATGHYLLLNRIRGQGLTWKSEVAFGSLNRVNPEAASLPPGSSCSVLRVRLTGV